MWLNHVSVEQWKCNLKVEKNLLYRKKNFCYWKYSPVFTSYKYITPAGGETISTVVAVLCPPVLLKPANPWFKTNFVGSSSLDLLFGSGLCKLVEVAFCGLLGLFLNKAEEEAWSSAVAGRNPELATRAVDLGLVVPYQMKAKKEVEKCIGSILT